MKLYEYQGKRQIKKMGLSVPESQLVYSPEDAWIASMTIGCPVVLKAQVLTGGRGKAGGVVKADDPDEVKKIATELLGKGLKTAQTGKKNIPVNKLLIEKAVEIDRELYFAILMDREQGNPVLLVSKQGGVDIEDLPVEEIMRINLDPRMGLADFQIRMVLDFLNLPKIKSHVIKMIRGLIKLFYEKDCLLLEINPLVVTKNNSLYVLDVKMEIDDNALFRRNDISQMEYYADSDKDETEAKFYGLSLVKLKGEVGCVVNGAGLAMATMDFIKRAGAEPANFLDLGGGATPRSICKGMELLLRDDKIKGIFINIFGGIVRCDKVASGIIDAYKKLKASAPLVVRLTGVNVDEGYSLLDDSNIPYFKVRRLSEALGRISEITKKGA